VKRIGIDVGGTNTDAVLLDGTRVVASIKTPTTEDVTSGVHNALDGIIQKAGAGAYEASAVIIGTTHFINAVVERKRLNKVAAVRVCLPASASIPPLSDWPADLRSLVGGESYLLPGGFEVDGREIAPFDDRMMRDVAKRIADSDVRAVAISSVFSPLRGEHEERAAAILQDICPEIAITQSRHLGRIGLLERENVAIMNAALHDLARTTTAALREAVAASGLGARLLLTQNDGTIMSVETAEQMPVFCFSSGPTNSMRGAAFLSGIEDAIVIDVGGTTSDIGVLKRGFPRVANTVVEIGGVRTLFRMPDVLSLAFGGGTRIHQDPLRLGPDSVAFRLLKEARAFGGATLTATDFAVARGRIDIGDRACVSDLDNNLFDWFDTEVRQLIENGVESVKTQAGDAVVIAVGGGAPLIPEKLKGVSELVFVENYDVANAVGAGMAQISGDVDQVFSNIGREGAIEAATAIAKRRALDSGADSDTLKIVDVEDLPLAYMPGDHRRVRVRVAGELRGL